jgi:hypothetical protein
MTVSGTNVNINVGFSGSPTAEISKISYPESKNSEGYFQGGKFDLDELLGAVPVVGPILKTGVNLISDLFTDTGSSDVVTLGTVTTYIQHPEAYRTRAPRGRPSISRQIQYHILQLAARLIIFDFMGVSVQKLSKHEVLINFGAKCSRFYESMYIRVIKKYKA